MLLYRRYRTVIAMFPVDWINFREPQLEGRNTSIYKNETDSDENNKLYTLHLHTNTADSFTVC